MQTINRLEKRTRAVNKWIEQLEQRKLLTAQLTFANFASTTGLTFNGYGSSPTTSNAQLVLTDATGEARSVLSTAQEPTNTFTAHFTYQADVNSNQADGFAFVIDNGAATDLGGQGQYFGYTNGTFGTHSVALAFDLYNNGQGGTYFGEGQGGAVINATTNASPLDLHNGDKYDFTVTYDGTNLNVSAVDDINSSLNFSNSTPINLATVLGGTTANIGFTGATGFESSNQNITAFDYTGVSATPTGPTITAAASSNPTVVTGTKSHLTVGATSTSGGTLTYAWALIRKPPGAATPTLTPNNTTSPTTTAHYFKDGTYTFQVTVTDSNGGTATSIEQVVVQQTATAVKLTPHKAQIVVNHTEQFSGTILDQFSRALRTQPTVAYAVDTGTGTIDALTGLYTAADTRGHLVISVTGDDLTGTAGATVIA